jgi:hypothetical protein
MSRGSPRGPLRRSSSTTPPRAGSSSTTLPPPRVRVPRHVARLFTRLVVDYFGYAARPGTSACRADCHAARRAARRRLLRLVQARVDYFTYVARSGASAHRVAHLAARRRLLRLRRASGCLSTSRGSSRGSSSTTSTMPRVQVPRHVATLVVNFDYATRPGASSRGSPPTTSTMPRVQVPQHIARLVVSLVVNFDYAVRSVASARRAARRRLLRLRCASGCLGTLRGSSSTTSPTLCIRVPRQVARLVVDFFAYTARPGASARHAARRRLLRLLRASGCLGTLCGSSSGSSSTTPCVVTTCLTATLALLQVCRALLRHRLPVASRRPFISTSFPN